MFIRTETKEKESRPSLTRESLDSLHLEERVAETPPTLFKYFEGSESDPHIQASVDEVLEDAMTSGEPRNEATVPGLAASRAKPLKGLGTIPLRSRRKRTSSFGPERIVHSSPGSVAGSLHSAGSSIGSAGSAASFSSINSRASRKGRRQWSNTHTRTQAQRPASLKYKHLSQRSNSAVMKENPDPEGSLPTNNASAVHRNETSRTFKCTFCSTREFKSRYAWRRHEESVHVPQSVWVCYEPSGISGGFGSVHHCAQKPESERTFFRKDNLIQHLRTTHKIEDTGRMHETIQTWRKKAPPLEPDSPFLVCPFCQEVLKTWEQRVDHIAKRHIM
jgi:hypothetical protein